MIPKRAAAVLLTRRDLLPVHLPHVLVKISGSASSIDTLALHDRRDALVFEALRISAQKAILQAGITLEQIGFFEYHDMYSVYAALALEAVGFAGHGQGWKLAADGALARNGRIPCATMGGLKARGFPGGATGVYQAVEAAMQLRGEAGVNQLPGVRLGLIQSVGGPGATAVSHVLEALA